MFLNKKLVDDSILANLKKTLVLTVVLNDDDDVVISEWSVALRYAVLQVDCLFNEINTELRKSIKKIEFLNSAIKTVEVYLK